MANTERLIRIGRVSSINYSDGMLRVTYPDMDDSVTAEFPVFAGVGEYKMPSVGDEVLVLHLSNGQTAGIVMGRYWNSKNQPAVSGSGIYRKELGDSAGEAYIQYNDGNLKFHDSSGTVSITDVVELIERMSKVESSLSDVESSVSKVESSLSDVESSMGEIESQVSGLESSLSELESRVSNVEDKV